MQPETQNEEEMSTTNNNFTVESLVAKYRNYVNENCSKEYFCDDYQDENGKWHTSEGYAPFSPDGDADEQLLVTLYKKVAGRNSDDNVLDALSKYADTNGRVSRSASAPPKSRIKICSSVSR